MAFDRFISPHRSISSSGSPPGRRRKPAVFQKRAQGKLLMGKLLMGKLLMGKLLILMLRQVR
jgi:hypothetical protein